MKYKVVVEEEKMGGYSAYVPELPGCASQGETMKEAMSNIKKAIRLYTWSVKERPSFPRRRESISAFDDTRNLE